MTRTYYIGRVDDVKINHAFRSSDHRTLCGKLYDKINSPIGDVLSCVACQIKVTTYSYSPEIRHMPKVYLRLDNNNKHWYIYGYSVSRHAIDEFERSCWYHPALVIGEPDTKIYIDIHYQREALVLETAMDFAKYFGLELELA